VTGFSRIIPDDDPDDDGKDQSHKDAPTHGVDRKKYSRNKIRGFRKHQLDWEKSLVRSSRDLSKSVRSYNLPAILAGLSSAKVAKFRAGQALAARGRELMLTGFAQSA
jgi:hypothetical protein